MWIFCFEYFQQLPSWTPFFVVLQVLKIKVINLQCLSYFSKLHSVFPIRGTSSVFTSMSSTSWDMLVNFKPVSIRINILINKLNCRLLIKDWRFKGAASIHLSQIYYLSLQGVDNFLSKAQRKVEALRNKYLCPRTNIWLYHCNEWRLLLVYQVNEKCGSNVRERKVTWWLQSCLILSVPYPNFQKQKKTKVKIATTKRKQIANHRKD